MASQTSFAVRRLQQDYIDIKQRPVPNVTVEPNPSNMLEWFYVVTGPEDSSYAGGYYLGRLIFPPDYPFRSPSVFMDTPNGKFFGAGRLCLTIDGNNTRTWNPVWKVSTLLAGLVSFMLEEDMDDTNDMYRRILAKKSLEFNVKDKNFRQLFPELTVEIQKEIKRQKMARLSEISLLMPNTASNEIVNNMLSNGYNSILYVLMVLIFCLVIYFLLYTHKQTNN